MKIILGIFLCLVFIVNSFASPLIFKTTKTISNDEITELLTIDTSKYKQIRIKIENVDKRAISRTDYSDAIASIFAVEGDEETSLFENAPAGLKYSTVIDTPPSKLRLKIKGLGTFKVYIWAVQ